MPHPYTTPPTSHPPATHADEPSAAISPPPLPPPPLPWFNHGERFLHTLILASALPVLATILARTPISLQFSPRTDLLFHLVTPVLLIIYLTVNLASRPLQHLFANAFYLVIASQAVLPATDFICYLFGLSSEMRNPSSPLVYTVMSSWITFMTSVTLLRSLLIALKTPHQGFYAHRDRPESLSMMPIGLAALAHYLLCGLLIEPDFLLFLRTPPPRPEEGLTFAILIMIGSAAIPLGLLLTRRPDWSLGFYLSFMACLMISDHDAGLRNLFLY